MKKLLVLFLVVAGVAVMLSGCGKKDVKKSKKSLASTVAIDFIRQAAEQGDAKSQYDLGSCYANGIGVEKNQLEAFNWWYKAAMQNYAQAQYEIGSCYEKGFGTVIFTPMAVYWYTQAAVQGHIMAQYQLGKCRTDGVGVAKSEYKALYWYTLAALQGSTPAMAEVGTIFARGKTYSTEDTYDKEVKIPVNREIAIFILEKSYRHNQQAADAWRQLFKMDDKDLAPVK